MTSSALTNTGALARLAFRRDRIMLPAWVYVITAAIASNSYSLNKLYPSAAARAQLTASGGHNPALVFLYGRLWGDSLGAVSAWRYGVWAAIFAALMSVFIVIRHTRADEEAGRLELVGSAAVGRLAALTAALLVALAANVLLAVLLAVVLVVLGLPVAGSVAFALAITTCGLAFAAIAALAAQLAAAGARAARGIAIGVLGAAYLLRAVGDASGEGGVSWLRAEETGGQAEPLLATAIGRTRWALSHIAVAVVGAAVLLAVAGVAAGLGYGLRTGSAGSEVARLLGAAMAQLPASLAVAGAAVVLFGLWPRASVAGAWTVVGVMVLIALFGQVLQLSQPVLDVSPFTHVPKLPGAAVTAAPLLWLSLAVLTLVAAGLAGLRRRDIV